MEYLHDCNNAAYRFWLTCNHLSVDLEDLLEGNP